MNTEHDPVAGELLGPTPEQLIYRNPEHRHLEMGLFWSIVEHLIVSTPGAYDAVPVAFREEATEALIANA